MLESVGLLTIEARPSTRSLDNQTTSISLAQEIPVHPGGNPNASPSYMEVGTFIQVTPRLAPTDDLAVVSMKITCRELIEEHKANRLPGMTSNEIATQATVSNDRYFSHLIDAENARKAQGADEESMLVLFKAQWDKSDASHEPTPAPEASPESDPERLVQLRVRVVAVDRDCLDDLGIELPGPPGRLVPELANGPAPSLARPSMTGAVVDTQALLAGLDELCKRDQAKVAGGPSMNVRSDEPSEFSLQNEEQYDLDPPRDANDSAAFVTITSGIKITATPHIEENDDVILEINAEISDVVPGDDPNSLPIVTRHTVRSTAKLHNGDTIVLGGATLKPDSQDEAPPRDTLILATVRVLSNQEAFAPNTTEASSSVQATLPVSLDAPGHRAPAGSPAASLSSQDPNAVQVQIQTRFLVLSDELVEALQRGTLIEDTNAPEEIAALATLEKRMTPNEWIDVDETVVSTLLKVAQRDPGSRPLAAPQVNVLAGESTWFALTDDVSYTAGYDDADDASGTPVARAATVSPGLTTEITPWLAGEDQITLNGTTTFTNLKGFEDRTYRDEHVYQVPVLDTDEIVIKNVHLADGQAALLLTPSVNQSCLTKESSDSDEARPLLILIKARKLRLEDSNTAQMPPTFQHQPLDPTKPLPPGFGALAPGTPPVIPKAAGQD